jgi:hypothetical protein
MDGVSFKWMKGLNRVLLELDPDFPIVDAALQLSFDILGGPGHDPELVRTAMNYPGLYRHLEPMEYAVEAAHEMEAEGMEVLYCSSPS